MTNWDGGDYSGYWFVRQNEPMVLFILPKAEENRVDKLTMPSDKEAKFRYFDLEFEALPNAVRVTNTNSGMVKEHSFRKDLFVLEGGKSRTIALTNEMKRALAEDYAKGDLQIIKLLKNGGLIK